MKPNIHPEYRPVAFVDLSINKTFIISSAVQTKETVEIDGVTYPLFKLDTSLIPARKATPSTPALRPASSKPAVWKSSAPSTLTLPRAPSNSSAIRSGIDQSSVPVLRRTIKLGIKKAPLRSGLFCVVSGIFHDDKPDR